MYQANYFLTDVILSTHNERNLFVFSMCFSSRRLPLSTSQISFEPPQQAHIIIDGLFRPMSGLSLTQGLSLKLYLSLGMSSFFFFFFLHFLLNAFVFLHRGTQSSGVSVSY